MVIFLREFEVVMEKNVLLYSLISYRFFRLFVIFRTENCQGVDGFRRRRREPINHLLMPVLSINSC